MCATRDRTAFIVQVAIYEVCFLRASDDRVVKVVLGRALFTVHDGYCDTFAESAAASRVSDLVRIITRWCSFYAIHL